MKYNLDQILERIAAGERPKYVFFWGHQKSKDGSTTKSCFSQWWEQPFEIEGIEYKSAEHWMMAEKARLFKDEEVLSQILLASSPAEAKKLGRKVRQFEQTTWETHRYEIVKKGNVHKFAQIPELKEFLLNTASRVLVEASPYDRIWGIGLTQDAEGIEHPMNWKGLNLLGFALMEVRDILQE